MRSPGKVFTRMVNGFGDIGLDSYEEVNQIVLPGDNFGWPDSEGPCEADCEGMIDPWVYYGRSSRHPFVVDDDDASSSRLRSVWVGPIYSPIPNTPDPYRGRWKNVLVFGDAFSGFVRARPIDGSTNSYPVGHVTYLTGMAQAPMVMCTPRLSGTWPVDAPMTASPIYRIVLDE